MAHLIAISVSLVLFFGFLGVTLFERGRGKRFSASSRDALDGRVSHVAHTVLSVDPLDLLVRGARAVFAHVVHDVANVLWAVARMLEQTLARVVYKLRHLKKSDERTETNSSFVKSISFHKRTLRASETTAEHAPTSGATVE